MGNILSETEVKQALYLDYDFDSAEAERLGAVASSYIFQKTGFDFSAEASIHPLAKQAAILYIRELYFGADGYNKEHDYGIGLTSLIADLINIANSKIDAKAVDDLIDDIPAVEELTLADKPTVEAAREAYDSLYIVDVIYVTKYATLQAAEAKIVELGG